MKLLLLLTLLTSPQPFTYGYLPYGCTLYSDMQLTNPITTLPATYFVIILSEDTAIRASYKDIVGFLDPASVEKVDYEPVTKFASASFTVDNDGYPVRLRSSPSKDAPVISEIPSGASGYYYGDALGDALIEQVGNTWRYVSIGDPSGTKNGYVYSSQVSVTDFAPNVIEKVEYNDKGEDLASPVSNTDFILIACLCVPSVLIMYVIFRSGEPKPRYKD